MNGREEKDVSSVKKICPSSYLAFVIKVLLLYAECTPQPRQGRDAGWQLGTWPTHWTTKWEKWPAFTRSFKNSFTSCQISLWPGTRAGAAGQDWAWVHWPCRPSSYQPDLPHWSSRQLILLCQGFLALLVFFFPSIFYTTFGVLLAKSRRLSECLKPHFYSFIQLLYSMHLKASAQRITPPECWALNTLSAAG